MSKQMHDFSNSNIPNTVKNVNSQNMNQGLQRALKSTESKGDSVDKKGDSQYVSMRGQKDVIIRKNSSKNFKEGSTNGSQFNRPSSSHRMQEDADYIGIKKQASAVNNVTNILPTGHQRNKSQIIQKNMLA